MWECTWYELSFFDPCLFFWCFSVAYVFNLLFNLVVAFFYCETDGSSLCLQCDMIVHVGGKRTHGRYLLFRQRVEVCLSFIRNEFVSKLLSVLPFFIGGKCYYVSIFSFIRVWMNDPLNLIFVLKMSLCSIVSRW